MALNPVLHTGQRNGEATDHIDGQRLFALAQMSSIVDQPEWKHIEKCGDCGTAYIVLRSAVGQFNPNP
jgi:hypothetical protein